MTIIMKTLKNLKNEMVGDDIILSIVNEIEKLTNEDRSIQCIEKEFPDENDILGETFKNYISKNDRRILKTQFPDK